MNRWAAFSDRDLDALVIGLAQAGGPMEIGELCDEAASERARRAGEHPTRLTDLEVWNFNTALAAIVADGLRRLADDCHGYPPDMTSSKWRRTLHATAADFQTAADDHTHVPHDGLDFLHERWADLWD